MTESNPTGGSTGDQIISWENNGLSSPSGPPSDIFWSETFEAPKKGRMTSLQAKKKFVALLKPYWIREITALAKIVPRDSMDREDKKIYDGWLKIAKSGKIEQAPEMGDTSVRERAPASFRYLQNYDTDDYEVWEYIVQSWNYTDGGPKSIKKQLKALLPIIEGKVTAKPKTTKKSKAKAKTGRKAPTISATRRKIGTRMRGNDGNMWEVKKSGKSQRWMAGAEGINKKGISWIDTEDDEGLKQDWDDETNIIENHLSSQGYNKCGSGKFFSDRTYAWVLHRFRRYIHDLPDKIKGYRGVVEDREYLEYFRDDQFVFSPWENKSKNKVALVWQFYDHHGFLVSEPYYKYFSLTTPPSWYHNKFELHIGEDYRYDACPICDYTNPMTTQSDARKLAAHIYSHGPIINGSPFNDFYIDIEPQYSDDEEANVGWGNPMWGPDVEIIASQLPYLYGFDFAEYWSPTKSQEARYRKKTNAIKAGLRAAGFKPKK